MDTERLRYLKVRDHAGNPTQYWPCVLAIDPGKRYVGLAVVGVNVSSKTNTGKPPELFSADYPKNVMYVNEVVTLEMKATNSPTSLELGELAAVLRAFINKYGIKYIAYEMPITRRVKQKTIPSSRETWEVIGVVKAMAGARAISVVSYNAKHVRATLGCREQLKGKDLARRLGGLLDFDLVNGFKYDHGTDALALATTAARECFNGRFPAELNH